MTDDYYEEEALAKCLDNGFTPHSLAHDEEIIANAMTSTQAPGRSQQTAGESNQRPAATFAPFYTLGGPTTQFGGSGADPWSEAGWGNKRTKLRAQGVSEEDWMLRNAEDCRQMDAVLREYRDERLSALEGVDATTGWVYGLESAADEEKGNDLLKPIAPALGRKRSNLSQEVTVDAVASGLDAHNNPPGGDGDVSMEETGAEAELGDRIVVETDEEKMARSQWQWGVGAAWRPGTVQAVYEVCLPLNCFISSLTSSSPTHICHTSPSGPSLTPPLSHASPLIPSSPPPLTHITRISSRLPSPAAPRAG